MAARLKRASPYFPTAAERAAEQVICAPTEPAPRTMKKGVAYNLPPVVVAPPPALRSYIVGIDRVTREYYRIEAESGGEAERKLVVYANVGGEELQLDGEGDSELRSDSVGDAFFLEYGE